MEKTGNFWKILEIFKKIGKKWKLENFGNQKKRIQKKEKSKILEKNSRKNEEKMLTKR